MSIDHTPQIENLHKVTMTVAAKHRKGDVASDADSRTVTFIYGIGASGLTPFEYALAHQAENGYLEMQIHPSDIHHVFGHLCHSIRQHPVLTQHNPVDVAIQIERIEPAANAEIIKAMADAAGCSDGCCGHEPIPLVEE